MEKRQMAKTILSERIEALVNTAIEAALEQALGGLGNVNVAAPGAVERDEDAAPNGAPQRRRRIVRRRPAPAVGYHPGRGVDGRTVKRIAADLPGNPGTVLRDVVAHPGSTNREIANRLVATAGWDADVAKKATESALYQLRTHDAEWNVLKLGDNGTHPKALIISRALPEAGE
jgi:hypothetical protein